MEYDQAVFEQLWENYIRLCPSAPKIHRLLEDKGTVVNDHIAFRTFNDPGIDKKVLSEVFQDMGYSIEGHYHFDKKKLNAIHLEHSDSNAPKIFISELILEEFSDNLQSIVKTAIDAIPEPHPGNKTLIFRGRPWPIPSYHVYEKLRQESEYAAWMYVYGFCANHFTIYTNKLNFKNLEDLNVYLVNHGFVLNNSGGVIKGSKSVFLEQSSTLADQIATRFKEGTYSIPGCYYEFAYRYKKDGDIFQGFVTESADKIFENTNYKNLPS